MMNLLLCFAILLFSFSTPEKVSTPTANQDKTPAAIESSDESSSDSGPVWQRVHPAGAGASVDMPGQPTAVTREFQLQQDRRITVHMNTVTTEDKNHSFIFAWHEHYEPVKSQKQRNEILEGAVHGSVTRLMGDLESVEPIRYKRFPGLAFTVRSKQQGKNIRVAQRVYLVRNRLYQLNIVGYEEAFDDSMAKRFMESFQFEKEEPAPLPKSQTPASEKDGQED